MTIETVYTISEIMEILKVSMQTVTGELTSGRLKSFRVGRQWRVSESSLASYIRGEFTPADFSKDADEFEEEVNVVVQEVSSIMPAVTVPPESENVIDSDIIVGATNTENTPLEQPALIEDANEIILRMKADGKSLLTIANHLNEIGILYKDKVWTKNTVNYVLSKLK